MKIHATKPAIKSMNLIVPVDGLITIDDKGYADVSAKCATLLVKGTSDWEFVGGAKKEDPKPAVEATEQKPADAPAAEPESEQEEAKEEQKKDEFSEENLKLLKVEELKATCKDLGLPEAEWKNLKKDLLVAYILKKAAE